MTKHRVILFLNKAPAFWITRNDMQVKCYKNSYYLRDLVLVAGLLNQKLLSKNTGKTT
jgi:hypothetical protein